MKRLINNVKTMKKFIYPFLAFFVVLYLLFSYNEAIKKDQGEVLSSSTSAEERTLTTEELNHQYQEATQGIINVMDGLTTPIKGKSEISERLAVLDQLEETVLEQKVPAQDQDLHLNLVSLINDLRSPLLTQQSSVNPDYQIDFSAVKKKIDDLKNEYSWLSTL